MKKINAIAWLITMLMTMVASPAFAASGTNYEVEVGKTLRLDISNFGVECMANGSSYTWETTQAYVGDNTNYRDYLTFTSKSKNYAIVKGVKAGKLVGIQYTGYYYYNGTRKEFYDVFYVRVVNSGGGPASLEVFPTPQTMKVGETKWVYAKQTKAIGGTYFYSENESIATVTHGELASEGSYTTAAEITAKKAGKVNIIAKNKNGLTAVCEVTVTSQPVSSISVQSSLSLEVGGSYTLTPTVYPSNAETSYTWSSDNSSVAAVSQYGVVTAKGAGTARITVKTDNGKSATCKVTVTAKSVTGVSVKSSLSMEVGETYTLTPAVTPSDAETSYTWSSDNSSVATVSQYGVVTAKRAGTAKITVKTDNGKSATCKVTVTAKSVTSVSLKSSLSMEAGDTYALTPTITPSDAETSYTWSSDNSSVAAVSQYGVVTAKGAGTARITVKTDNGKSATCKVTVNTPKATEYTVRYYIHDNGIVLYNGATLTDYDSFKVTEGSDVALTVIPDDGYKLDWIWIDYEDVKDQLVNNVLTIHNIRKDMSLTVSFEKSEVPVVTTENVIELGNVTVNRGTTVAFPVSLTNKDEITALQMDLHLPSGITFATDADGDVKIETSNRVSNKHTIDCNKMADGSYRIICYSTKNNAFTGNSGTLFNLLLNIDANAADGDNVVTATGVELSDMTGTAYTGKDAQGTVTVKSYLMGDVDGNGQHSINDVVCIINRVLNRPNSTFVEAAADLDGNGEVSVNDAVLLIKTYILGQTASARQNTRAAVNNGDNYISIDDIKMQPGEVKTVEVLMTNDQDNIKGVQCDIILPSGISFLYDEDEEDYVLASWRIPTKMALSSEKQGENTLRVAGVCTGLSSIYGNSGSVFKFKVKADDNIMAGVYQIQLSNVELSYGEAICVSDRFSSLEITENTSGIATLTIDKQEKKAIYDLRGQRVDSSKAKNGIFIVNGKKVVIR